MRVSRLLLSDLHIHAGQAAPAEACGFLLLDEAGNPLIFVPVANEAEEPERSYAIEKLDLALAAALEVRWRLELAVFHSHPQGPGFPSAQDLRYAGACRRAVILDMPRNELRAFRFERHRDERHRARLRAIELPVALD